MIRLLRIAAKTTGVVAAVVVVAVLTAWGAANTRPGQRWLEAQVEAALSTPDAPARVEGLHGAVPHAPRLDRLSLADSEGRWLTVTDARLVWHPLALVRGRLHIAELRAGTVALDRLPASGEADAAPADAPGELALPELPVSVRVDALAVTRLELGEAVAGQAATFAVEGEAAAPAAGTLSSHLRLERLDAPGGNFTARAAYSPGSRRLDLTAALRGEPGGLVASTLDLPAGAATTVRLAGDAPVDAWRGTLDARLGKVARADLDVALDELTRLTVEGSVEPGPLPPEPVPALLGGPVELDLAVAREGEMGVRLDGSTLTTPTTRLTLDGTVDAGANRVDLRAEAALPDPGPVNAMLAPAELTKPEATLTATGPPTAPELTLDARAASVASSNGAIDGLRAEATYSPDGDPHRGELTATLTGARVTPPDAPVLAPLAGEPLTADLTAGLDLADARMRDVDATLALADARVRLDGGADLAAGSGDAAVSVTVPRLARFTEPAGFAVAGTAHLNGHLRAGGATPLAATLTGRLETASWPEPALAALLGADVALAGNLTLGADGGAHLTELLLEGAGATARGGVRREAAGGLDGNVTLSVPELAPLGDAAGVALAGDARLDLGVSGSVDDPRATLNLAAEDAAVAATPLGTLSADASLSNLADAPRVELTARAGATPAGPIAVSTTLTGADPGARLSGTRVEADGITATSETLAVDLDSGGLEGTVTAAIDSFAPVADRFGLDARGSGTLTATLTPGSQDLTLDGDLRGLALPARDVRAERVRLDADFTEVAADPSGEARLTLEGAHSGPASLETARLTATGSPERAEITLDATGDAFGPVELGAAATLRRDGDTLAATLSRLDGRIRGVDLALAQPARARLAPDGLRVRDLALDAGGGRLTLDLTRTAERIDTTAGIEALPLKLARLVLPRPRLTGKLDASVELSGPLTEPTGRVIVASEDLGVTGTDLPPLDLTASGELGDGAMSLRASLSGVGEEPIDAEARLPMRLSLDPLAVAARPDAPIEGTLTWSGEVAPIIPFVPVAGHALAGAAAVEARVGGTLSDPTVAGHATLSDATYENLSTGTLLRQLNLRVEGTGDAVRVTELRAKAGKGTVSGSGRVALGDDAAPAVSVSLEADGATLVRRDELTARADADLTIEGSFADLGVAGDVTVTRANILIPKQLPPSVRALEVTREIGDGTGGDSAPANGADAAPPMRVGLDVTITVPNRLFVRGNGLETEWQGELTVTGTADDPVVAGEIRTVRGQLSVLNRAFVVEEGVLTFAGGRTIDPRVQVRAVAEGPDLTGIVRVSGPASQPEIALESEPPLPSDAILSRLLFGKNPAELGTLEAAQLGTALAQLTGGGLAGGGFMERVRNLIGVDVLRLGGSEGDAAVTAGTYITRDVFVGVEQGTTAESGAVRMELGVTDNISVESNVGATGDTNVGVQFKWDY